MVDVQIVLENGDIVAERALLDAAVARVLKYSDSQPRDNWGRWSGGGGDSATGSKPVIDKSPHLLGSAQVSTESKQGIGVSTGHDPTAGMTATAAHEWKYQHREQVPVDAKAAALAASYRASQGLPNPTFGDGKLTDIRASLDRARVVASTAMLNAEQRGANIDTSTRVAYNDLVRQTGQQLGAMQHAGIKVEYLSKADIISRGLDPAGLNPYPNARAQRDSVSRTGKLMIASISDYPSSWHPLLDSSKGGTYDQFRAVHDYFGHVAAGTGFDRHGEFQAYLHHASMFHGPARQAAASELHVENSFLASTGMSSPHFGHLLPDSLVNPYNADGSFKGQAWVNMQP